MRQQSDSSGAPPVQAFQIPNTASHGRISGKISACSLRSIPEQNVYKAAEEEVSIPIRSEPVLFKGMSMAGGVLKRSIVKALVIISMISLLALNTSILVLTAKSYDMTRQLGTVQSPLYSTDMGWTVLWADEFESDGLDGSSWTAQTGDGTAEGIPGWGNMELETYDASNVAVGNGVLSISAQRAGASFSSGRITSAGERGFVPAPGETLRIEARIQLPQGGDGIWPAFWMLPAASPNGSLPYGVWPRSGEIDVMESVNAFSQVFGTVHYGLPQQQLGAALSQSASTGAFAGAMHVYAVDWSRDQISWYMDGRRYASAGSHCKQAGGWQTSSAPSSCSAPFDRPFGLLLNVAVGGLLPGRAPGADTIFPQTMLVDYVRVYSDALWRNPAVINATHSSG